MRYVYPCELTPEKNGGYSVSFPNVPEALTCGDDRGEALAMAEEALTVALGSYVQGREDIPVPDTVADDQEMVAVPRVAAAKLALYTAMSGREHDAHCVRYGPGWLYTPVNAK